jgi:putative membrane-bound dehydrogenase-like protein
MTMFAAEPDIVNPISFCIDDRGRLWVVEGYTYPQRAKDGEGKDRIIVFEDKDGDGKAETRTVFMEKLNLVSGIEVGFGGVWIGAAPNLMFIPMQDGDTPKPAGEPKILLDGWGYQDTHETLNTFRWGPDGWLYGCHGVFTQSNVGKPGAPDSERTRINAGFWRYHPTRHQFELFAEGTSNPWGIDFDEHGQFFAEACVIPHLFHVIQGRALPAPGGPALQSEQLTTTSRPSPTTATTSAPIRMGAMARATQQAAGMRTRVCSFRKARALANGLVESLWAISMDSGLTPTFPSGKALASSGITVLTSLISTTAPVRSSTFARVQTARFT